MKTEMMRSASLLLLAAINFLFVGTEGQVTTKAEFKAKARATLEKKVTSIRKQVRKYGLYAYSPKYRKWVAEQEALKVKEDRADNAAPAGQDFGNGQKKNGRKKGWRRRRWRRRRRRRGGLQGRRKKNANKNRVNDEAQPTRKLQGIETAQTDSAHRFGDWLQSRRNQQRRRNQDDDVVYIEFAALTFIVSAISPLLQTNFVEQSLWCAGVDPITWIQNANPFTGKYPIDLTLIECIDAVFDPENALERNFTLWTIDTITDGLPDNIPASTAHLADLNDITTTTTEDDETTEERNDEYNVWMSTENEPEENQWVQADRTSVFDMAPVDEFTQTWFFLAGPTGDRTWRPWPQGPYYGAYNDQVVQFPYNRNLCVAAQKFNDTVSVGNKLVLKKCTDQGRARERQTWVYCALVFQELVRNIDPPLFDVVFTTRKGTPSPTKRPTPRPTYKPNTPSNNRTPRPTQSPTVFSPSRLQDYTNQQVQEEALFNPDTDVEIIQACTVKESALEVGVDPIGNWTREFSLNVEAEVDIELTTICGDSTSDASELGLDTIFRLYKESTSENKDRECINSIRLSCDTTDSDSITEYTFSKVEMDKDRKYYITASGYLKADVVESGDFNCFF